MAVRTRRRTHIRAAGVCNLSSGEGFCRWVNEGENECERCGHDHNANRQASPTTSQHADTLALAGDA